MTDVPLFMMDMELLDIPIDQIQVDDFIPRRKVNKNHVQDITESNSVDALPPLIVFRFNTTRSEQPRYSLIDGQHRLEVLRSSGHTSVQAFLLKTDKQNNAFIASIVANNSHGLRFSNSEKKRNALILHQRQFSLASIAQHLQVNRSTVHRWLHPTDKPSVDSDLTSRKLIKNVFKSILAVRKDIFLDDDIENPSQKDVDYLNELLTDELNELKDNDEKSFFEVLSILIHFVKRSKLVTDV